MKANTKKEGSGRIRLERVNIIDIVSVLNYLFKYSDYADIIVDPQENEVYIESSDDIENEEEVVKSFYNKELEGINDVVMTYELFKELSSKY